MSNLSRNDPHLQFHFNLDFKLPGESGESEQKFKLKRLTTSKNDIFNLDLLCKVLVKPKEASFTVVKREFKEINMNDCKNEYANFELDKLDYTSSSKAMRTYHSIMNHSNTREAFQCEILHVIERKWSGIRILKRNKLIASSSFVGISQLPIDKQIGLSSSANGISLEKFEKAMLVRNLNGDYAIVKGKWTGLKVKANRHEKGDPGRLSVTYYSFNNSDSVVKCFEVPRSFIFKIENGKTQANVNLKTGAIDLKFNKNQANIESVEVESMLALVLSVSTLHVILQPKRRLGNGSPPARNAAYSTSPSYQYRRSPYDNFLLLSMIGYHDIMHCTHYRPHLCDDYFLNECENTNNSNNAV